MAPLRTINSSL
jgi:hypothetical protein